MNALIHAWSLHLQAGAWAVLDKVNVWLAAWMDLLTPKHDAQIGGTMVVVSGAHCVGAWTQSYLLPANV
jgi:hypothetical protein